MRLRLQWEALSAIGARAVTAAIGVLATPIFLSELGVEAYGVIGVFNVIQYLAVLIEFGLPASLTRVLAGDEGGERGASDRRSAARTFEWVVWGQALLLGLGVVLASPLIAHGGLHSESLGASDVSLALQLGGISLALLWPCNLYTAGLGGLQRQYTLAVLAFAFGLLRIGLTLYGVLAWGGLVGLFLGHVICSLAQLAATVAVFWHAMPKSEQPTRFERRHLSHSRSFALGVSLISLAGLLLLQIDKLVVSYVLSLDALGIYTLASSLAVVLHLAIGPFFAVIYPRFSAVSGDRAASAALLDESAQTLALLLVPAALALIFFPTEALFAATANLSISERAADVAAWLALACLLHGFGHVPFALQLGSGWTTLSHWLNIPALLLMGPLTWWAAKDAGAVGAAAASAGLMAYFLVLSPPFILSKLVPGALPSWLWRGVLLPLAASGLVAIIVRIAWSFALTSRWTTFFELGVAWLLMTAACALALPLFRGHVVGLLHRRSPAR